MTKGELTVDMMRTLALGFNQNNSVTELFVQGNLMKEGANAIFFETLRQDTTLKVLNFRYQDIYRGELGIGPNEALRVIQAITNMPNVTVLNLAGHYRIGFEGLTLIARELPMLKLRELDLSFRIQREHPQTEEQFSLARDTATQAILQGLRPNHSLFKLRVCSEIIDANDEFYFYTHRNFWRHFLVTTDDDIPLTIWCYIFERRQPDALCRVVTSLIYYILSERPDLVRPYNLRIQ